MYKVELNNTNCSITNFNNTQLICSYIYLSKTFNHIYKKKLRSLSIKENKAIIYDLSLFQNIKQKKYLLRSSTPQKWLENWSVFNGITEEMRRRELPLNNLEYN